MKRSAFWLTLVVSATLTTTVSSADDIEGLWSYRSYERPGAEAEPLAGLFLFHGGRFMHQAMHGGEPLARQLTDAHIGTYRIASEGVVRLDVETGVVVTPAGDTLLAGRSGTNHKVGFQRIGSDLQLTYSNGTTEKLVNVETAKTEFIPLERGMLALTDEHFVLVANPADGWVAGSGRYEMEGDALRLEAMRWFEVRGDEADYAAEKAFEATFDGELLRLPDGHPYRVVR